MSRIIAGSFLPLLLFVSVIAGCDSQSAGDAGTVTVRLVDMPFPFDDALAANVTIVRVELIGADSTKSIVLSDSAVAFNLLDLQNGVSAELASLQVPDGKYSQLRLIVAEDAAVVMKDSTVFDLKIPSGSQTGIKIKIPEFELTGSPDEAVVTVDFDVSKSFVVRGNPANAASINGFIFKPVLKVVGFEFGGIVVPVESSED